MPTKGARFSRDPAMPVSFQTLTLVGAAAPAPSIPTNTIACVLVENIGNGFARYRIDPGAANVTTAVGHGLAPGAADNWSEQEIRAAQFIGTTTLAFTYYLDK